MQYASLEIRTGDGCWRCRHNGRWNVKRLLYLWVPYSLVSLDAAGDASRTYARVRERTPPRSLLEETHRMSFFFYMRMLGRELVARTAPKPATAYLYRTADDTWVQ